MFRFKCVADNDLIILPKLATHGYLPIYEQILPFFDPITQSVADSYEIKTDQVLHNWSVSEQPFIQAQQNKIIAVEQQTIDNIKSVFGDIEQAKKVITLLTTKDNTIIKVKAVKTNPDLRNINLVTLIPSLTDV